MAFLFSAAGCDSDQYVLFSIQGVPVTGTTSVRTVYELDTSPDKKNMTWLQPPLDQFAIMFPGDTRGDLTATVQAYTFLSPTQCYQSSAVDTSKLSGAHKTERTVGLPSQSAIPCDPTHVAVTFPPTDQAPLASWGNAANNIWVVGAQGAVFYWDGTSFTQIPLPADLAASPPTWRSVSGPATGNTPIWMAGDRGVMAYWDGTKLITAKLVEANGMPSPLSGDALPSWVSVAVADAAQDDVFLVSSNGLIGHNRKGQAGVQIATGVRPYPVYPIGSAQVPMSKTIVFSNVHCIDINECWLVGYDPKAFASGGQSGAGVIMQVFTQNIYSDYSMTEAMPQTPVTRSRLNGIWTTFVVMNQSKFRHLYVIGENATALSSSNSVVGGAEPNFLFPRFKTEYTAPAVAALAGRSQTLYAIGGTGLGDLWVAGDGGLLMKWDAAKPASNNSFAVSNTGALANLTSVFSTVTGAMYRVFASGDRQTFLSLP